MTLIRSIVLLLSVILAQSAQANNTVTCTGTVPMLHVQNDLSADGTEQCHEIGLHTTAQPAVYVMLRD